MNSTTLSLQAITLGEALAGDIHTELARVERAGYRHLEAGLLLFDGREQEAVTALERRNITLSALHTGIETLLARDATARLARILGSVHCDDLILSGILNGGFRASEYTATGRLMARAANEISSVLNRECRVHYHHYDFDLRDPSALRALLNESPSIGLVLDTYWAIAAGCQPLEIWRKHHDRVRFVHVKDGYPGTRQFAAVGSGQLKDEIRNLIVAIRRSGTRDVCFVVEQDHVPYDSVEEVLAASLSFLTDALGEVRRDE